MGLEESLAEASQPGHGGNGERAALEFRQRRRRLGQDRAGAPKAMVVGDRPAQDGGGYSHSGGVAGRWLVDARGRGHRGGQEDVPQPHDNFVFVKRLVRSS